MFLTCPACSTRYSVDDAKFGTRERKVRCARCGEKWIEPGRASVISMHSDDEQIDHQHIVEDQTRIEDSDHTIGTPPPLGTPEKTYPEIKSEGGSGSLLLLLLCALLVLSLIGAYHFKDRIINAFPEASGPITSYTNGVDNAWDWILEKSFIDPVAASGMRLTESAYDLFEREEGRALGVFAVVENQGQSEVRVPPVTIILRNNLGEELFRWSIDSPVDTLQPEESTEIRDEIMLPPDGIAQVEFDFSRE